MGLFGRGFIAREIAIQDMQAVAEAIGKSHKGEEPYRVKGRCWEGLF